MLVIAIVLIVVVGPKDLPKIMRRIRRTTSQIRAMAGDFRKPFERRHLRKRSWTRSATSPTRHASSIRRAS